MVNQNEKQYLISESVRDAMLNYLSSRPWVEANPLITALLQTPEIVDKEIQNEVDLSCRKR